MFRLGLLSRCVLRYLFQNKKKMEREVLKAKLRRQSERWREKEQYVYTGAEDRYVDSAVRSEESGAL